MEIIKTKAELRTYLQFLRANPSDQRYRIAFVPTMGALHEGHLSLVREAKKRAAFTVVSIFVNPLQFGPHEDFQKYPRPIDDDIAKLRSVGTHLLFFPSAEEMYAPSSQTTVSVSGVSEGLCGATRHGHFQGVATVVTKLFGLVRPDVALFGEKDYQQLQVIKTFTRDLDLGIEILGIPTIREPDGLAMSSRNAYLSPLDRSRAVGIYHALRRMQEACKNGDKSVDSLVEIGAAAIRPCVDELQYLEIRDAETLSPINTVERPARALCAAHLGTTRLIDNIALL